MKTKKRASGPDSKKLSRKNKTVKTSKQVKLAIKSRRPIHRRVMLHPLAILVLLCVGIFVANLTRNINADNIRVTATVPAPALQTPAVITSPTNGSTLTSSPIDISGTCPLNSYIKLQRNGIFSGSAWCQNNQKFTIQSTLSNGVNDLSAQDYNITDQAGRTSPIVSVTYSPSSPQSVSPTKVKQLQAEASTAPTIEVTGTTAPGLPLLLTTNYTFKSFLASADFNWQLDLSGGTPPYVVIVNWEDGNSSKFLFKVDPLFTISHQYKKSGYYPIQIQVIDAAGHQTSLQVAALIHTSGSIGFMNTSGPSNSGPNSSVSRPSFFSKVHSWLWLAWSSYTVAVLVVFSFWLGERQEYLTLVRQHSSSRYR